MKPTKEQLKQWEKERLAAEERQAEANNKTQVRGPLDGLLKGLPGVSPDDLVGKPITDVGGTQIGIITGVSIQYNCWYGDIIGGLYVWGTRSSFSIN